MQRIVRRKWLGVWGMFLIANIFALPAQAEGAVPTPAFATDVNTVRMVTFFPMSYVLYNNLYPQKKLDIGTAFGQDFVLELGEEGFKAKKLSLKQGTLEVLNDFTTSGEATFGLLEASSGGDIDIKILANQLYLKNVIWKNTVVDEQKKVSFETIEKATLNANLKDQLKVFNKTLPACSGTVRWKKIGSKCYLVCCGDAGGTCSSLANCN